MFTLTKISYIESHHKMPVEQFMVSLRRIIDKHT